jgi:hypothetical protein
LLRELERGGSDLRIIDLSGFFIFFGSSRSGKPNKGGGRGENSEDLANISGFSAYRGCQSALYIEILRHE